MATSFSSSLFSSPNFTLTSTRPSFSHSHSTSFSNSNSISITRYPISAAYATTAERTAASVTETNRSYGSYSQRSLYEVLGVEIGADTREVKSAYRRLARVLHPDVGSCESSADEFMRVHSAYATLADPVKRAEYDRSLVQTRMGGVCPVGGCRSGSRRRWETDQCW
ncbi:putative DnaJ domain, Chaperone J-domain superfamily [Helianthus annuus]|uniref:DnaJ domain, Chaperone J-domain superfamily n=1 Tax=Helianthus annuus TaxID=4232 RepID=A0A251SEK5_HELAN|nr:chaperone protein dnaJ 11, chloroplastic [Helianthus annuus]KAF5767429.1 putative DnaJ domain, Chaperone J-domain superfamily [Helianthus annuus]KAJ0462979.1 putative DnaJ domain, Chaperone J-domain superfamily [Helianthus annuus]KAJ0466767.1 putative DnaJ domain, Chaperone J-domain superfamily [Helianthus annuus]KAJ0484337.1 putative DnaJ domain, Chaperone J-domain superfamily [Helianthus annuus]KAJ0654890.1 putative DnaJ domain, Chaperone J-domain superfamily [Helianthus annuus]